MHTMNKLAKQSINIKTVASIDNISTNIKNLPSHVSQLNNDVQMIKQGAGRIMTFWAYLCSGQQHYGPLWQNQHLSKGKRRGKPEPKGQTNKLTVQCRITAAHFTLSQFAYTWQSCTSYINYYLQL